MNLEQLQSSLLLGRGLSPQAIELGLGVSSVHTNAPIENLLVSYQNTEMIADQCMPVINRGKKSDLFYKLKPVTSFNVPTALIASQEASPNRAGASLDTAGTYLCKDYGLMDFISTDEEANADAPLEPRLISERVLMNYLMLAREIRVAAVVFGAANYGSNTGDLASGDKFDTTSDPAKVILGLIRKPLVRPNVMVIGAEAWDQLRTNAKLIAYVISRASTSAGPTPLLVDPETVAKAFRLDKVIIGESRYNTAREGGTASYSFIWGKSMALIRVEPNPSPRMTGTFGYTFRFTAGSVPPFGVQSIFAPIAGARGGNFIKVVHSDDDVVVGGANAGYLATAVIA
jgi:hypothetical protein